MENNPTNLNKIVGNMMTFLSTLYPNADVKKIWCDPDSAKIEFLHDEKPYTFEICYNKWAEVNADG